MSGSIKGSMKTINEATDRLKKDLKWFEERNKPDNVLKRLMTLESVVSYLIEPKKDDFVSWLKRKIA